MGRNPENQFIKDLIQKILSSRNKIPSLDELLAPENEFLLEWQKNYSEKGSFFIHIEILKLADFFSIRPESIKRKLSTAYKKIHRYRLQTLGQTLQLAHEQKTTNTKDVLSHFSSLLDLPLRPFLQQYYSMINEISDRLGKKVHYHISGDDIFMIKEDISLLTDTLVHMIRNSLDHGFETTEERKKTLKSEIGRLEIHLEQNESEKIIIVRDDGRGIDDQRIKKKVIEKNLKTQVELDQMSNDEIVELIFLPSFSTAESVSDLSGRGVGMDVVKTNVEQLSGTVKIKTRLGEGTNFIIRLKNKDLNERFSEIETKI